MQRYTNKTVLCKTKYRFFLKKAKKMGRVRRDRGWVRKVGRVERRVAEGRAKDEEKGERKVGEGRVKGERREKEGLVENC